MPLQKASTTINFAMGIDTLTDQNQLGIGKFISLQNSVFIGSGDVGRLNKRNGFGSLTSLPDNTSTFLTSFKDNLLAIGNKLEAYSSNTNSWLNTGTIQPLQFSAQALGRNFYSPTMSDSAQSNGVIGYSLTASPAPPASSAFFYAAADAATGQNVIVPTAITPGFGAQSYGSRVFSVGPNLIYVFDGTNGGVARLQYFAVNALTLAVGATGTISSTYQRASGSSSQLSFDGAVSNNKLYLSFSSVNGLRAATIDSALSISASTVIASGTCDMVSVAIDTSSGSAVYTTFGNFSQIGSKVVATNPGLSTLFSAQTLTSSGGARVVNIASNALGGFDYSYLEMAKSYTYGSAYSTNFIAGFSTGLQGSVSNQATIARSSGLASKAFSMSSLSCFVSMYSSQNQSTYFLNGVNYINNFQAPGVLFASSDVIAKFAYGNSYSQLVGSGSTFVSGSRYVLEYQSSLPAVSVIGSSASVNYLLNTQLSPINKGTNIGSSFSTNVIYTNQGINYAKFDFGTNGFQTREIANNLHLNGGILMMHDGAVPVEHNFFLYPDNISLVSNGASGSLAIQAYYYQVLYKWTDGQGNIHRSSPSLPLSYTTASGTSSLLLNIPCPRITYKPSSNPIVCSIYRWSTGQPVYYKIQPDIVFDTTALQGESIPVSDSKSDAQIIGNEIIYTNGGVVEDISAPPVGGMALFDARLWLIDAEDPNTLWFSKQCIEGVPVELSDLLTYFVPPASSETWSSGPVRAIAAMDDKLILFKKNSIFYINGTGPDITGANSQYSQPIFITNGIGCTNQASIVLVPQGLMFQSAKGIWLLGRDLSLNFIGKESEDFNNCNVISVLNAPSTNEVRFTLDSSSQTLTYDYLAGQWDQFTGIPSISSIVYKNLHTNLQTSGSVSQETIGTYLDNGTPTTMGFTTGWINLAGLQGYIRVYRMFLLGKFLSPHTYTVGIAYDYNPQIVQTATISPTNVVGSGSSIEQWQINFDQQQTQAFQLTFQEISSGTSGAGLYLSGIKLVYGAKADFPRNLGTPNKTS